MGTRVPGEFTRILPVAVARVSVGVMPSGSGGGVHFVSVREYSRIFARVFAYFRMRIFYICKCVCVHIFVLDFAYFRASIAYLCAYACARARALVCV